MRKIYTHIVLASLILFAAPLCASAATTFEVSGWMPYWRTATSTRDVTPHLSELTEINPFVYSMSTSGTIVDNGPMTSAAWTAVVAAAKAQKVRVVRPLCGATGSRPTTY